MSAQPVNLHLGPGNLFFKRSTDASGKYMLIGSVKGAATFSYNPTFVEATPGNGLTAIRRDKTAEAASLKVTVVDFKIPQLIAALGQTLSSTQITITSTLRVWQEIAFASITTSKTLAKTAVSITSIVVTKLDQSTKYAKGTDFTAATTKIKPITSTFAHGSRMVAYDTSSVSATVVRVGDSLNLQVVSLKFTSKMQDGKHITIEIPKATIMGGLTLPLSMDAYTTYEVNFGALGDSTKPSGQSLFKIIRQA